MTKPKAKKPALPRRKKRECPRMMDYELRDFVNGYCDGAIWTSEDMPVRDVGMVFIPLKLGAARDLVDMKNLAILWADIRKDRTVPKLGINGRPVFFSFSVMHRDDWRRAVTAIKAEGRRRKEIKV